MFTGSFSKVLFPSLRLGYLVIPPDLVEVFSAAISVTSRHAPVLEQAVLCDFIEEGTSAGICGGCAGSMRSAWPCCWRVPAKS